ncbi:uncharacterized protein [Henckelia pumila]|uniref:uncharacterized protein n=1 Tax=Henckelia pumila TaxID=405737 RepID=UPI003C6DDC83
MGDEVTDMEKETNQSDSFTLHHSDHPSSVLVSKPLDGNNYGQWSRAMRIALSDKNKIDFINGTVEKPKNNDGKFQIWERCNHMVLFWILNSVESDIAGSIIYTESATDIWNDLQERSSQRNDTRIFEIIQKISELREGQQSVPIYYTKI